MAKRLSLLRRITRWVVWVLVILAVLFALQVTILAFPQIVLRDRVQVGAVALYHDGGPEEAMRRLAADVDSRLRASRFYNSTRVTNLYYFLDQGTYEFFTDLTFMQVIPQGFNLPELNNSYVSDSLVAALGNSTGRQPRYSIWAGDPAHTAAHEIGHQYSYELLGRRKLPHWKQEGLPEYIANTGLARQDSLANLDRRIGILLDDSQWRDTPPGRSPGWARLHYEAWLLMEYLLDVEGRTLDDVMADSVSKEATHAAMMKWYRSQRGSEETILGETATRPSCLQRGLLKNPQNCHRESRPRFADETWRSRMILPQRLGDCHASMKCLSAFFSARNDDRRRFS